MRTDLILKKQILFYMYAPRNQVFQVLLLIVGPFGATFVRQILARVKPIEISHLSSFPLIVDIPWND
jgi:hypothetical protein